jgi:hypothetical protein
MILRRSLLEKREVYTREHLEHRANVQVSDTGKNSRLSHRDITIHDAGIISTANLVPEQSEQYTNW